MTETDRAWADGYLAGNTEKQEFIETITTEMQHNRDKLVTRFLEKQGTPAVLQHCIARSDGYDECLKIIEKYNPELESTGGEL